MRRLRDSQLIKLQNIGGGWHDGPSSETGFTVQRADGDAPFVNVGSTGAGTTNYTDTGLSPEIGYVYRVEATNGVAPASAPSTEASATTFAPPPSDAPPAALGNSTATATSFASAAVSVNAPTDGSTLELEEALVDSDGNTGNFSTVGGVPTISDGTATFQAFYLTPQYHYAFRVRALLHGQVAYSPQMEVTMPAVPDGLDGQIATPSVSATVGHNSMGHAIEADFSGPYGPAGVNGTLPGSDSSYDAIVRLTGEDEYHVEGDPYFGDGDFNTSGTGPSVAPDELDVAPAFTPYAYDMQGRGSETGTQLGK